MSVEKVKRKNWSREETLGLLKCYSERKNEFVHARKKKLAFEHVLQDMISQNITDSTKTTKMLENKMQILLSGYKSAKDNARQTGAAPCPAPFMEEMDEIFGNSAHISNEHTLQFGFEASITSSTATVQELAEEPPIKKENRTRRNITSRSSK